APGRTGARLHPYADRARTLEGSDQAGAGGRVRARGAGRARSRRAGVRPGRIRRAGRCRGARGACRVARRVARPPASRPAYRPERGAHPGRVGPPRARPVALRALGNAVFVAASEAPSIFLAFAAGLVSFVSPCVLPLVPGYLSTVCGLSPQELQSPRTA